MHETIERLRAQEKNYLARGKALLHAAEAEADYTLMRALYAQSERIYGKAITTQTVRKQFKRLMARSLQAV